MSIVDNEVFKVKAELFNGATAADGYSDMSAVDIRVGLSMGRMRAIFLNKFVMRLLVSEAHDADPRTQQCVAISWVSLSLTLAGLVP